MAVVHQHLPASGPKREALRVKGQFWTPAWVAEAMVAYLLPGNRLFDPAVGAGAFFLAAKQLHLEGNPQLDMKGYEVDSASLLLGRDRGLTDNDLAQVRLEDFLLHPPSMLLSGIVANPPYIRHHRLSAAMKAHLKRLSAEILGQPLDGRAGLHIYFLIQSLKLLNPEGRLAFLIPADTCEGIFATPLWRWISQNFRLEAVATFHPDATPFPGVDTNAMIFFIKNAPPGTELYWVKCLQPWSSALKYWVLNGFQDPDLTCLEVYRRPLSEGLSTGLSRHPSCGTTENGPSLLDFAKVQRGIATGANEFFFLTKRQIWEHGLPDNYFRSAIGRTRDADEIITQSTLDHLEKSGRPTRLLCLDGRVREELPDSLQTYLTIGEKQGLPDKPLIAQRKPWYKMEVRQVPPFFFAYLGRRNVRFIRNLAGAVPLTGFLCIYPHNEEPDYLDKLWQVLNHPLTIKNLALVGKSYGDGAIKVEPRSLERLPIPISVLEEFGLTPPHKLSLF